jgi:hypothetical protein
MEIVQDTTKFSLSLKDRIILPSLFNGKQGSFTEVIIIRDIKKKVDITQEEVKKFEIIPLANGALGWNVEGQKSEFEYEFTDLEVNEIKLALKEINDKKLVTEDHIHLFDVFDVKP